MKKHWQNYVKKVKCEECANEFEAYIYNLKRNWGKFCSTSCSKKGNANRLGKSRTEEEKKKISDTLKKKFESGELVSPLRTLGLIGATGEKAANWQGGKTLVGQNLRQSKQYKDWRKNVLKRDDYICFLCKQRGGKLEVDHIKSFADYPDQRLDLDNGRTLCKDCHHRVTHGWKPEKDFRKPFMDALMKIAEERSDIVFNTCDVGFSFLEQWQQKYPNRFFNFGVTEMSTAVISATMALSGLRPVFYSMINFVLYRPFEMIRNAVCYHNAPVLLAGVQGSTKYKMLGFSHTSDPNEDINLLYYLPNIRIYIPLKDEEVEPMLRKIFSENYPAYIRL